MAINLQKGGRIDLSKESTASVFRIGLGWMQHNLVKNLTWMLWH